MSTVVIVTSPEELAVASAAIASGVLAAATTTILVVTVAVAAELHPTLNRAALAMAAEIGSAVVHLNEVISPRHPLAWRRSDFSREEFLAAWDEKAGAHDTDRIAHFGPADQVVTKLARMLRAAPERIADTPELAAAFARRRGRHGLMVAGSPGVTAVMAAVGTAAGVVPRSAVLRAAHRLEQQNAPIGSRPSGCTPLAWWVRFLKALPAATQPPGESRSPGDRDHAERKNPAAEAAASIAFTERAIETIDRRRQLLLLGQTDPEPERVSTAAPGTPLDAAPTPKQSV